MCYELKRCTTHYSPSLYFSCSLPWSSGGRELEDRCGCNGLWWWERWPDPSMATAMEHSTSRPHTHSPHLTRPYLLYSFPPNCTLPHSAFVHSILCSPPSFCPSSLYPPSLTFRLFYTPSRFYLTLLSITGSSTLLCYTLPSLVLLCLLSLSFQSTFCHSTLPLSDFSLATHRHTTLPLV